MKIIFLFFLVVKFGQIKSFEELSIETSIREEQDNGTMLVDLRSSIDSLSLINKSDKHKVKFLRPCLDLYFDERDPFKIRSPTLDREELCPYVPICSFDCQLVIEREEIKFVKLKVNVEDVNDHRPKFKKKFYSYEFESNLSSGFRFQLEQAEDKDLSEANSIENYLLNPIDSSSSVPFELHFDRENHLLELVLMENLPRETNKTFRFQLIAADGRNEEDQCLIEIKILQKQENDYLPPRFDQTLYRFYVLNSDQTLVGRIRAENPSQHPMNNKQIHYRLIPSIDNANLFRINETTGEIFLNDKEKLNLFDQFYEIFIEAFYFDSLSSLTTVQIYFNLTYFQFNENHPGDFIEILVPKLFQKTENGNRISIQENSSVPLPIFQLFVSSSSSSSSSSSTSFSSSRLHMESSIDKNYFYLKQLDQQLFEVILVAPLDYEFVQQIHLDFVLNRRNSTRKSLEIIVENINDCQPTFDQSTFHFQIQENNRKPFLLHTFHAFDRDRLNEIRYEIETSGSLLFFSLPAKFLNGKAKVANFYTRRFSFLFTGLSQFIRNEKFENSTRTIC